MPPGLLTPQERRALAEHTLQERGETDPGDRLLREVQRLEIEVSLQEAELLRLHAAAADARRRATRAVDDVPLPVLSLDQSGTVTAASLVAVSWFGVSTGEVLVGSPIERLLGGDGAASLSERPPPVHQAMRCALETLHPQRFIARLRTNEGAAGRAVQVVLAYISATRGYSCVLVDAPAPPQSLVAWFDRLQEVADHFTAVVVAFEPGGTVSVCSEACAALFGLTAEAVQADPEALWRAVHERDRSYLRRVHSCLDGTVDMVDELFRVVRGDGSVRWLRERAYLLRDEGGDPLRLVGTFMDVTAAKVRDIRRHEALRAEALGTLASGIAHDFANLLMGIGGCARISERRATDPKAKELLAEVASAAERGTALARQLLLFSRKGQSEAVAVRVDEALRGSRPLLDRLVGSHVQLALELGAAEAIVKADPVQIDQVVMNLATNARDAMPDGGVITVRTTTAMIEARQAHELGTEPGHYVRIDVGDTGMGMDSATAARVLEPYFTTKPVGLGTGLGLSTVQAITTQLGGALTLHSVPGQGTQVSLWLPIREEAVSDARDVRPVLPLAGGTVLLLEPDPLVLLTVRDFLERLEQRVVPANTVEAAIALAETTPFDVLLTDVVLPNWTGPRLAARLRRRLPGTKTLFVSAQPHQQLVDRRLLAPDAPFLQKPFDLAGLRDKLGALEHPL